MGADQLVVDPVGAAHRLLGATLTGRGVEGVIVGKALYAGRFTLPQALATVRE